MQKNWERAAARYEAAKQPGFKARKKSEKKVKPTPSLAEFLANGEGAAALKLLAASGQEICFGHSEQVMSTTTAVVLDGEGLKTVSGVVGMASAYTQEKPTRKPIDVSEALRLLARYPEEGFRLGERFDENDLVPQLRERLDTIADEAP